MLNTNTFLDMSPCSLANIVLPNLISKYPFAQRFQLVVMDVSGLAQFRYCISHVLSNHRNSG